MKVTDVFNDMEMYYLGEHKLNFENKLRAKVLEIISIFQKNKDLRKDIQREIDCYEATFAFYDRRTEKEITDFYETKQDRWYENLLRDLKPISIKYNVHLEQLYEYALELQEETKDQYITKLRIENGFLIGGDDEIIESIKKGNLKISYSRPEALFTIQNISTKKYSDYMELVSYWIFLNISKLIQLHGNDGKFEDFTPRVSNEIASFIIRKITGKAITRDTLEKGSSRHIHLKAHGAYFHGYYYEKYRENALLRLSITRFNKTSIKKTSDKNLKNIICLEIASTDFKWCGPTSDNG